MAAPKKVNPFAKFEKSDKAADKKKGVKESPFEDVMDKKMMAKMPGKKPMPFKAGGKVGKKC